MILAQLTLEIGDICASGLSKFEFFSCTFSAEYILDRAQTQFHNYDKKLKSVQNDAFRGTLNIFVFCLFRGSIISEIYSKTNQIC